MNSIGIFTYVIVFTFLFWNRLYGLVLSIALKPKYNVPDSCRPKLVFGEPKAQDIVVSGPQKIPLHTFPGRDFGG